MIAIRKDIDLIKGPTLHGRPSWVLYDPVNDSYVQLSHKNMAIIKYGHLPVEEIIAHIDHDYKISVTEDEVKDLAGFIQKAGLSSSYDAQDSALKAAKNQSHGWMKWLIHHYLFIRFRIGNPDKLLSSLYSVIKPLFQYWFIAVLLVFSFIDGLSVWSQWGEYSSNFKEFLTPSGVLMGMIAVGMSKTIHEFGHGIACKHYGVKVPSCGVAFLVMAPVLWTDTTGAWRLRDNYKRVLIDCAGMFAEIILAITATLLWAVWDNDSFRHFLFILSSTTWVMAVMVNVSPLMRFDGYRILSDLLGIPNLMERAFSYSKWRLRKLCLDLPIKEPDDFSEKQKLAVLIYSPSTWIYRFGLFTGIALMVYHATFHALGIILMGIEIGTFVLMPIIKEMITWFTLLKEHKMTKRAYITFGLLVFIFLGGVLPIVSHENFQSQIVPEKSYEVFLPSGQLKDLAQNNQFVKQGDMLGRVVNPDNDSKLKLAQDRLDTNEALLKSLEMEVHLDSEQLSNAHYEHQKITSEIYAQKLLKEKMTLKAPFDGTMIDRPQNISIGQYVNEKEHLGDFISKENQIIAYVPETLIKYLHEGDKACFHADYGLFNCRKTHIIHIDYGSVKSLKEVELSSVYHGSIKSHKNDKGDIVPDEAYYRIILEGLPVKDHKENGVVRLDIRHTSIFGRFIIKAASLIIKESGF